MGDLWWLKELFLRPLWFHFLGVELSVWVWFWFWKLWHNWLQASAARCLWQGGAGLNRALFSFGVSVCDSQNIDLRAPPRSNCFLVSGICLELFWPARSFDYSLQGTFLSLACCPLTWRKGPPITPPDNHSPKSWPGDPIAPKLKKYTSQVAMLSDVTALPFSNR